MNAETLNEEIGKRIKTKRLEANLTLKDVGLKVGLSEGNIQRYEAGKIKGIDVHLLTKIATAINTTPEYLMGWEKSKPDGQDVKKTFKIPVLGSVPAGIPIEAIEEILDWEEISGLSGSEKDYFALKIHGDSMEPKISDGDIVIVRKQCDVETGETAIVRVNATDATCKKILKNEAGIILFPTNPVFEPTFFSWDEIEEKPITILGKVVELRAKF